VVSTTGIAILFPLFNDMLGVIGAVKFWPLVVYFPVEMYIVQKKSPKVDTQVEPSANFELHITSCISGNSCWLHRRPCERQQDLEAFQYGVKNAEMLQYSLLMLLSYSYKNRVDSADVE